MLGYFKRSFRRVCPHLFCPRPYPSPLSADMLRRSGLSMVFGLNPDKESRHLPYSSTCRRFSKNSRQAPSSPGIRQRAAALSIPHLGNPVVALSLVPSGVTWFSATFLTLQMTCRLAMTSTDREYEQSSATSNRWSG